MLKRLTFICSFIFLQLGAAQTDFLNPGDSIILGTPADSQFRHIFLVEKTRFPPGANTPYDTLTGKGFYNSYFQKGDFNMGSLSPDYAHKTFAVISVEILANKDGEAHFVAFLKHPAEHTLIWLELQEALEVGELMHE